MFYMYLRLLKTNALQLVANRSSYRHYIYLETRKIKNYSNNSFSTQFVLEKIPSKPRVYGVIRRMCSFNKLKYRNIILTDCKITSSQLSAGRFCYSKFQKCRLKKRRKFHNRESLTFGTTSEIEEILLLRKTFT